MALAYLGSDGFDNGLLRVRQADYNGNVAVGSTYKHTGAYSLSISWTGAWVRYAVTGTPANCSVSVWLNMDACWNISDGFRVEFDLSTGETIDLRWDGTNHTFDAYVDDFKVADGTINLPSTGWFHLQFYAVIDNAGSINVKIGGQESIAYSGDTLPDAAAAEVAYVRFFGTLNLAGLLIDNLVWGTGGYLGDCRVEWLAPNADTAVEEWSLSTGVDSYALVDEVPPNTTDYLYTDTDAQETELELADWDDTDKTPLCVTAWARAYEDAATAESLRIGVDSGGVDDITEYIMTDNWLYYSHFMNENPDGPAPWDNAAIDALKHRIESVI